MDPAATPSAGRRIGSRLSAVRQLAGGLMTGQESPCPAASSRPPASPSVLENDSGLAGADAAAHKIREFSEGELGYMLSTQRRGFDEILGALQSDVTSVLKAKAVASVNPRNNPKETIKILLDLVSEFVGEAGGAPAPLFQQLRSAADSAPHSVHSTLEFLDRAAGGDVRHELGPGDPGLP